MPAPGVCLNIIQARQKEDGYGSFAQPEKFFKQDYKQLTEYCIVRGFRFLDESFPPDKNSIGPGILSPSDLDKVKWLRPAQIAPNPSLVVDGISRFDFGQGRIGNCWFLASIGALTFQKDILKQVIPLEQSFDEGLYCGLFHFRFWRFGRWVDVVIDDKLPTINGQLIFIHSNDVNEFWPALLEKAYAKVCGSYTDMTAGSPAEALMDFTGGVHISIQLSDPPSNLWELMLRAGTFRSLMCCGTKKGEMLQNTVLENGLVAGHAYTITGVIELMSQGKKQNLVRLWNPWGKKEWNGDWSDKSPLWNTVSPQDRERCLSVHDDGEFWMTMEDLHKNYLDLDICCLSSEVLDSNSSAWKTSVYEGRWVAGTTAGGCLNNPDSFWTNPQYRVKIFNEDKENGQKKNVLVSLMQKPDKRNRRLVKNLHIGFSIFKLTEQHQKMKGKFPSSFFYTNAAVAQSKTFMNARDVMEFLALKSGEYLIVPSTFKPNETASFILAIISKEESNGYENSGQYSGRTEKVKEVQNRSEDENKKGLFRQYSDMNEEVDAEQLQQLLNGNILKGDLKNGGFTIDACRSMVALMDTSITGKLNVEEFLHLWNKVSVFKDIFFQTDVSKTGTLSLSELRNAIAAAGMQVSDDMLNLMALRYGTSSGHMTLESFISLILRLDCMYKIFNKLSSGNGMTLQQPEWLYISMYT